MHKRVYVCRGQRLMLRSSLIVLHFVHWVIGLDILAGQFTLGIPVSAPLTGIRVRSTVPVLEWQALGPLSHLPRL